MGPFQLPIAMKIWQLVILSYNIAVKPIVTLTLLLFPVLLRASPAEERPDDRIAILEKAQEIFGARANFAANRLDSFFATERADDEFGRSRIRIRSQFLLRERAASDLNNQYRINLRLPHLEDKFHYEYYKDKKEEKKSQKSKEKILSAQERELLKRNRLRENWLFNTDIGVGIAIPPRLTTRARVRRNFEAGSFIHRFVEQLTYVTDQSGLVEETSVDSDYTITPDLLFRFVNYKRWQVLEKELFTNHGPTLLHRVTEDDAFNYSATLQNVYEDGTMYLNNYRLAVNYRRNLYYQWIYLDVIPGIDFPKIWSFRRTPFLTFQLEVLFGG